VQVAWIRVNSLQFALIGFLLFAAHASKAEPPKTEPTIVFSPRPGSSATKMNELVGNQKPTPKGNSEDILRRREDEERSGKNIVKMPPAPKNPLQLDRAIAHGVPGSTLTIMVLAPHTAKDYTSPQSLILSIGKMRKRTQRLDDTQTPDGLTGPPIYEVGHTMVEVKCEADEASGKEEILMRTASTSYDNFEEEYKLADLKIGFTFVWEGTQGIEEGIDKVTQIINDDVLTWGLDWVALGFRISRSTCERLIAFHDDLQKYGVYSTFRLASDPTSDMTAGCSSLGASFVKSAGLWDSRFEKDWIRELKVPERLMGGPKYGGKKIDLKVMVHDRDGLYWAWPHEKQQLARFFDPEKMYAFIEHADRGSHRLPFESIAGLRWMPNTKTHNDFKEHFKKHWNLRAAAFVDARSVPTPTGDPFAEAKKKVDFEGFDSPDITDILKRR
jgi:hypothetical protein